MAQLELDNKNEAVKRRRPCEGTSCNLTGERFFEENCISNFPALAPFRAPIFTVRDIARKEDYTVYIYTSVFCNGLSSSKQFARFLDAVDKQVDNLLDLLGRYVEWRCKDSMLSLHTINGARHANDDEPVVKGDLL